jgi:predicted dehydrogenase
VNPKIKRNSVDVSVDVMCRNSPNRKNGIRQAPATNSISFISAAARAKNSPRLRVGVVGCGYWGSKHVRVLSSMPEVSSVAVIDRDARTREKTVASFPSTTPYQDLDEALPHVDAVIVASPPHTHCDVGLKCLRAGKHVLLEKPIAKSMSEALLLVDEARRSNLTLMPGHTFEFNPAVNQLKRRIVRGELGHIHSIHSSRLKAPYRPDVNVVWDLAPHDISIMNCLLDSMPSTVAGMASLNAGETQDVAFIRLEYREIGVTGFAHLSWLDPKKTREVTVVGSKKMAVYNDLVEERLQIFKRSEETSSFKRPRSSRCGDIVSPRIDFKEPLALEVEHFVHCVQRGIPPRIDGKSGLTVIAVLEAIDEAIATGAVVKVQYPEREACEPISKYSALAACA